MSSYIYVDDTDPHLAYSDAWFESSTAVATSLSFSFTASSVFIIGQTVKAPSSSNSSSGPSSIYILDNSRNTASVYIADAVAATNVLFFSATSLSYGKHTLDIVISDVSEDMPFYLDVVAFGISNNQPSYIGSSSSDSVAGKVVTVTTTMESQPTLASTNVAVAGAASSLPVGAIVGGVIGGVALIIASALAFYFLWWRTRRPYGYRTFDGAALFDAEDKHHPMDPRALQVQPFLTPGAAQTPYSDHAPSVSRNMSTASHTYPPPGSVAGSAPSMYSDTQSGSGPAGSRPGSVFGGSSSGRTLSVVNDAGNYAAAGSSASAAAGFVAPLAFATPAQRKAAEAQAEKEAAERDARGAGSSSAAPKYHADSGVRFDDDGKPVPAEAPEPDLHDVPPEYTEI
ncbi:uncharacterized protein BXZ73DRAFT_96758 [Epithele typhae]|uniref:uncharacterized protein n=1 Tax=Epithele typhae TaxID=378194 RepID=UPI002007531C|nr:uncharacterized protein BXZ73DRAFT_96758 [Epithele typhae]KAH9944265.1 hypothetical protein BXZ73DRAFT_96758 [Epithele typhae]